ncbi:MAG: hypoxanthine phosphoribosyltransferase [Clostridiales bacterium]|nr:hypoxanthine phosphoribosyltransferase [Clostridiales bacterium]MCF8021691.1 hypoxanthine phosphoribosyltransferase [Clostridiales bacterium]
MRTDAEKILLTEKEISDKVKELGQAISSDYENEELLIVGILKGAFIFMSDLVRSINCQVEFDFMAVSSYGLSSKSTGVVRIMKDLEQNIENRHVILVEDIVDTGLTLKYLLENLRTRKPASLKICTLLDKPERREVQINLDYCGFQIPDEFVVGYGLDYAEKYRNLKDILVLRPEVYNK